VEPVRRSGHRRKETESARGWPAAVTCLTVPRSTAPRCPDRFLARFDPVPTTLRDGLAIYGYEPSLHRRRMLFLFPRKDLSGTSTCAWLLLQRPSFHSYLVMGVNLSSCAGSAFLPCRRSKSVRRHGLTASPSCHSAATAAYPLPRCPNRLRRVAPVTDSPDQQGWHRERYGPTGIQHHKASFAAGVSRCGSLAPRGHIQVPRTTQRFGGRSRARKQAPL